MNIKKPFISVLLFVLFWAFPLSNSLLSQSEYSGSIFIKNESAQMGKAICLPVQVTGFDSINAMQASVNFDPFQLRFDSITNDAPELDLTDLNLGVLETPEGIFRFQFFRVDPFFMLPDSSSLFSLCFTVIGEPGEIAPVNITEYPIEIEVVKNFEEVLFSVDNGTVQIEQPNNGQFYPRSCAADSTLQNGSLNISFHGDSSQFPQYFSFQHLSDSTIFGSDTITSSGSGFTADSLPEGMVAYTITSAGGVINDTLLIRSHGKPNATYELTPPDCYNTSEGSIEFTTSLDNENFINRWSTGLLFDNREEELSNGSYIVYLTEKGGCVHTDTLELFTPEIELESTLEQNNCPEDQIASILVMASGGTPSTGGSYQYEWETGSTQNTINALRDSLPSGKYYLTVTDSNSCQRLDTFEIIDQFDIFAENIVVNHVKCKGDTTGQALFEFSYRGDESISGLAWNLNYSRGDFTADSQFLEIQNLPAGDYQLTIMDTLNSNCESVFEFSIAEPDSSLRLQISEIRNESCPGSGDGSIEIDISGGTVNQQGNYEVIWSNGSDSVINDSLAAGFYRLEVIDSLQCRDSLTIEIQEGIAPSISNAETTHPSCYGSSDGKIILQVEEGTNGSVQIEWDNGSQTDSLDNLEKGIYQVIVSDTLGCSNEEFFELTEPDSFSIELTVSNESGPGNQDGSIALNIVGGIPPYQFNWADTSLENSNFIENLGAGEYCLTIMDANECETSICIEVDVASNIEEVIVENEVSVFPNPATDQFTVMISQDVKLPQRISIIASDGTLIQSIEQISSPVNTIESGNWPAGIYFIELTFDNKKVVRPLSIGR